MKLVTTKKSHYLFNGNSKDIRIDKSLVLTKDKPNLVLEVLYSSGHFDKDSRNIKRYAKSIEIAENNYKQLVKVSKKQKDEITIKKIGEI